CESLDSTGGWLSASRFKRCAYSMNSGSFINSGNMPCEDNPTFRVIRISKTVMASTSPHLLPSKKYGPDNGLK
ncbi:hypothetical protein, partial [Pseudomonas helleri]|uniref:hypothetical protein n=1 Tax=Pseudomonas helleri TaxID=1608996 RepID=UPI001E61D366